MNQNYDREWREELELRRWAIFHIVHSFCMALLYGWAVLIIIQNAGVMAFAFAPMILAMFAIGSVPRLRRARSMLCQAEVIRQRRIARLPRK